MEEERCVVQEGGDGLVDVEGGEVGELGGLAESEE